MSVNTEISWADSTWNVVIGCDKVSTGCDNCYAIRTAHRMQANPNPKVSLPYAGTEQDMEWTGRVNLVRDRLDLPLHWRKPRRIFVNAQSDLFHKDVPDHFIADVFGVMAANYQWDRPTHTFQILTKRHARMRSLLNAEHFRFAVAAAAANRTDESHADAVHDAIAYHHWPLPNVWLGVSVENQQWANTRIPYLLDTPAAVRWLSMEPLLGPVELEFVHAYDPGCSGCSGIISPAHEPSCGMEPGCHWGIDWVVVGGESGPGARPMHPDWARSLRDQCVAAGVPFHFKQWGEWQDGSAAPGQRGLDHVIVRDGRHEPARDHWAKDDRGWWTSDLIKARRDRQTGAEAATFISRVGKKAAGRELDGRTWDQYPDNQGDTAA